MNEESIKQIEELKLPKLDEEKEEKKEVEEVVDGLPSWDINPPFEVNRGEE